MKLPTSSYAERTLPRHLVESLFSDGGDAVGALLDSATVFNFYDPYQVPKGLGLHEDSPSAIRDDKFVSYPIQH